MSLCTTALNKEHMPLNLSPRDQIEVKAHDIWEVLDFLSDIMKTKEKQFNQYH